MFPGLPAAFWKAISEMTSPIVSSRETRLRISEIFYSLQGESTSSGQPTLFIRLTGCPLRCHYCDTEYAFHGGETFELAEILGKVSTYHPQMICVTGGEPLAQPSCLSLLTALCDAGYPVSLETSGAMTIDAVDPRVRIVMDLKTPDSGEAERNLIGNIIHLKPIDEIKFVICSEQDYHWSKNLLAEHQLDKRVASVLFSPAADTIEAERLAALILQDNLPVRMQLQLHKLIWGNRSGV